MNFRPEDKEHVVIAVIYSDSEFAKKKLNEYHPDVVVPKLNEKEEARLRAMYDVTTQYGNNTVRYQAAGIKAMFNVNTLGEQLAAAFGQIPMIGYYVCPGCLDKAIFYCEEQLQALKDLREAVSEYEA